MKAYNCHSLKESIVNPMRTEDVRPKCRRG
jgi:hypothetical protein